MTEKEKTIKSIVIMVVFTLGGKVLGFFREMLIASRFGSGAETDAFFMAISGIYLFSSIVSSSINTTFIPILFEIEEEEGKYGKIKHTNNMLNIMTIISMIIILIAYFLAPYIVKVMASGFNEDQFIMTINLFRLGLPMILFSAYIGTFTGYLHSEQSFFSTSILAYPMNLVYIVYLIFFYKYFQIPGLMVTAVLAYVGQYLIQIPIARKHGFNKLWEIDFKDVYIKKFFYLSLPVILGVGINDVNAILDKMFASRLIEGSVSALNYATKLNQLILGVFIMAITTVVFPLLSKEVSKRNKKGVAEALLKGIRLIFVITIPAVVGMIVLSKPIVSLVFERGAFDSKASIMTAEVLVYYSLGLVFTSLKLLLDKAYYSLKDTKLPMYIGIVTVLCNSLLNLLLVDFMGHKGLALATSISVSISTLIMYIRLDSKEIIINNRKLLKFIIRVLLSSLIMGLIVFFEYKWLIGRSSEIIAFLLTGFSGLIVYIWFCYIFRVDEIVKIIMLLKNRWRGYES